jgi:uncharacterized protein YsxB (DUF464 family)
LAGNGVMVPFTMQAVDRASNELVLAVATEHAGAFDADHELACAAFELALQGRLGRRLESDCHLSLGTAR